MIAYLVRPIALKIKPYVKFETLAIFLAMILLATPIVILIYFTVGQILLLASDIVGALPSPGNSTLTAENATLKLASAQSLGSFDDVANELITQIGKLIGQFVVWLAGQIISTIAYIPS
jgi:predicted PurR-regulated permease PerM